VTGARFQPGPDGGSAGTRPLADAIALRRRARVVAGLRDVARAAEAPPPPAAAAPDPASSTADEHLAARCDLCATTIPGDHRHLLQLMERRIACVCESCWALHSGDAEYRPTGSRTVWLADLALPDELWASFEIPIGLAFLMQSTVAGCVVALYPSPAGATESELHFHTWSQLVELNPILGGLEPDVEGLIVDRLSVPPTYAIAPIDRCYALTGLVKASWEGISGGARLNEAVAGFLAGLRAEALGA
jgi:hypothetical protein